MRRYNLDEIIALDELRSKVAGEWRKHSEVTNPKVFSKNSSPKGFIAIHSHQVLFSQVIDLLVFKGQEELENLVSHSKQRHHVISRWIVGQGDASTRIGQLNHRAGVVSSSEDSDFLRKFYESND